MTTLTKVWQQAQHRWPGKTALITGSERLTYRELAKRICSLAGEMTRNWGIQPGEVVALLAPNSAEFVISYFAITSIGAMVQPIDERLKPEEMRFVLDDSGARFAIVHRALWHKFINFKDKLPALGHILAAGITESDVDHLEDWMVVSSDTALCPVSLDANDVAELLYTSGTTGRPKGVMRSHANARAASGNARHAFGYRHDDIIAIVMPLSHSSALVSQMLPMIEVGGTALLMEGFDSTELLATMRKEAVTCLRAVPAMFKILMANRQFHSEQLLSLRLLMNSSAAIEPNLYRDIRERFPFVELVNSYGLTEASTCTILSDAMTGKHPDSIGLPIQGVELSVVDENGNVLGDDVEGELWVRGPHVFLGYRGLPTETAAALAPGGWLKTGDMGRRDAEGLFYFHGRADDVINCAGRKFAPLEIESCIMELPEIADVAVVGVSHRVLGQVAKAFVIFQNQGWHDPKLVIRHCTRRLPSYKVPFHVQTVSALPRNSLGKVLHRELKIEPDKA